MSITKRQFDLLKAMDITVWQRRELPAQASACDAATKSESHNIKSARQNDAALSVDLSDLINQQLFTDIIHSLGVSSADLSINNHTLDLGIINWQFSAQDKIEFKHNCLVTPTLSVIAASKALKRTLWQALQVLSKP